MESVFVLIWVWILAAPVVAFVARRPRPLSPQALTICSIGLLSAVALAAVFNISFVRVEANILTLCAAYLAYCYLAFFPVPEGRKPARYLVRFIASVPIFGGYLLATVGVLGLGLIIADATEPPWRVTPLEGGLVCKVNGWGAAMTDSGYTVSAYRRYGSLLERRVTKVTVNQSAGEPEAECADIAKSLQ
ncbi:hypothetical protein C8N35_1011097 [Breoghania corrubedonensis]|uniref:Uncharacterized protein n=1 Tax=Breoghania corrubedonensis TaxID=665038 RepID=A0A2T5VH34_9HYPH|nr:hypothetical protein [Breoghania corrubedonensis]PTW63048.1 hypothetical protein C8N35_1011097 [Breoghania corrubedonensis]